MYASPPLPPSPLPIDDEAAVVLKKRRRLLQPKSVWDAEQVRLRPRARAAPS
jgi:hypothetical protein